jgi:hypothetical protein
MTDNIDLIEFIKSFFNFPEFVWDLVRLVWSYINELTDFLSWLFYSLFGVLTVIYSIIAIIFKILVIITSNLPIFIIVIEAFILLIANQRKQGSTINFIREVVSMNIDFIKLMGSTAMILLHTVLSFIRTIRQMIPVV